MNKTILLLVLILTTFCASSQVVGVDGLYYNEDQTLYSGVIHTSTSDGEQTKSVQVFEGQLHGDVICYYASGKIAEQGHYVMGKKDGKWQQFNEESILTGEAFYRIGLKDGIWTVWDDNGIKRYHMVYSMGKKVDVWKMWDENSTLVSERIYE